MNCLKNDDQLKFNIFSFISAFARNLIEIFVSLYLFKSGCSVKEVLLFYLFVNLFAMPLSYLFVYIGEKIKYTFVMIIGFIGFILVQILLWNIHVSLPFIILTAFMYSVYRRGYWVARRFYITEIMPTKGSAKPYSFVMLASQIATIVSSYLGATIFDNINLYVLTIISVTMLLISTIPLFFIKCKDDKEQNKNKIELLKNLKLIDKKLILVFSFYELNNLSNFIFPLYVAVYIIDSYSFTGGLSIVNNIAVIIFILLYGRLINKDKNYLLTSTLLLSACVLLKAEINSPIIMVIYFIEGFVGKMQTQSVNKVYFEERKIDVLNYNLLYQFIESGIRAVAILPLLFLNDPKYMLLGTQGIILLLLLIYIIMKKIDKKVDEKVDEK